MKPLAVLIVACALTGLGCKMSPTIQSRQAESGRLLICIVGRDTTISIRSSPDGPLYSVENKDGRRLIPGMTLSQLQVLHRDLAERVQSMYATEDRMSWAGM